jgi:hypothetical protein
MKRLRRNRACSTTSPAPACAAPMPRRPRRPGPPAPSQGRASPRRLEVSPATWSSFTRLHPCDCRVVPCARAGRGSPPYHDEIPRSLNLEASLSTHIKGRRAALARARTFLVPELAAARHWSATGELHLSIAITATKPLETLP